MSEKEKKAIKFSELDLSKDNSDVDEVLMSKDEYMSLYSTALANMLNITNRINTSMYSPMMAQDTMQSMFLEPVKASQTQLNTWLKNPEKYSTQLTNVSQFLSNTVMQYMRSVKHFSGALLYNDELVPLTKVPTNKAELKKYLEIYDSKKDIVRKIQPKLTFRSVTDKTVEEGASFYIINETSDFITLYPLPKKYCYITGRWNLGWTFALDLSYFDTLSGFGDMMPELVEAYKDFTKIREISGVSQSTLARSQYYAMNPLKSWVFMFEMNKPDTSPPLKPVFKDATEILSYKDMLKQKTMLDTVSLVVQTMPKDKDGNLKLDYSMAADIAQLTQSMLPRGVKTIVTPCETEQYNFTNSQSQNNVIGLGEELYWKSIGVSSTLMGESSSSALTMKYSLESDASFIDHMYYQFSNFMYVQLNKVNSAYKWGLKFFGDRYSRNEDIKLYQSCVQGQNMHLSRLYAMWGYEPYEWENVVDLENALKIKDKVKPIMQASQMSNKDNGKQTGRQKKDDTELGDSGANTRDYQSNENSLKTS